MICEIIISLDHNSILLLVPKPFHLKGSSYRFEIKSDAVISTIYRAHKFLGRVKGFNGAADDVAIIVLVNGDLNTDFLSQTPILKRNIQKLYYLTKVNNDIDPTHSRPALLFHVVKDVLDI